MIFLLATILFCHVVWKQIFDLPRLPRVPFSRDAVVKLPCTSQRLRLVPWLSWSRLKKMPAEGGDMLSRNSQGRTSKNPFPAWGFSNFFGVPNFLKKRLGIWYEMCKGFLQGSTKHGSLGGIDFLQTIHDWTLCLHQPWKDLPVESRLFWQSSWEYEIAVEKLARLSGTMQRWQKDPHV